MKVPRLSLAYSSPAASTSGCKAVDPTAVIDVFDALLSRIAYAVPSAAATATATIVNTIEPRYDFDMLMPPKIYYYIFIILNLCKCQNAFM